MTAPIENKQEQVQQNVEQQRNDKEYNFRMLEAKYQRELAQERAARLEAENAKLELEKSKSQPQQDDEDDSSDPYVDHKKLDKKLSKYSQNTKSEIEKAMEIAKNQAKEELRQETWLENNPDFYDVMQLAEKFAQKAPQLADTILRMPEGFERQKLVYNNIKALGIDKPEQKASTIQDKVDANRRSPMYQPSMVGNAPYAATGDFSASGQKNAYDKMQELKNRLRLG